MKLIVGFFLLTAIGCQSAPKQETGVDREAIRQTIRSNLTVIRKCYEDELNKDENLKGKILLQWDIGKGGKVVRGKLADSSPELKKTNVSQCILGIVQSLTFPEPPTEKEVTVIFPFYFKND